MVEHVAAGEEQDRDQTDGGPHVAALDDRDDVGPCDEGSRCASRQNDSGDDPLDPVDWALDGRMRAVGKVTGHPGMDLFGRLGSRNVSYCPVITSGELTHSQSHIAEVRARRRREVRR